MPDVAEKPAKKKRTPEYLVQQFDAKSDQWFHIQGSLPVKNAVGCERWIRTEGKDGQTYRIVRIVAGPFTVKENTKTIRKLT